MIQKNLVDDSHTQGRGEEKPMYDGENTEKIWRGKTNSVQMRYSE